MTKTVAVGALFGVGVGLMSVMPLVSLCCCVWAILGGMGAVYTARSLGEEQTVFSGALAGFAGGLVATLMATSCVGVQLMLSGGLENNPQFQQALEQQPPEAREFMENFGTPGLIAMMFVMYGLMVGGVMTIGGAIGGAVFAGPSAGPDPDGPWNDGYGGHDGYGKGGPEPVGGPVEPAPDHLKPL